MKTPFFEIIAVAIICLYYIGSLIYQLWSTTVGDCKLTDFNCSKDCQCIQGICGETEMGDTKCCIDYVDLDGKRYCSNGD